MVGDRWGVRRLQVMAKREGYWRARGGGVARGSEGREVQGQVIAGVREGCRSWQKRIVRRSKEGGQRCGNKIAPTTLPEANCLFKSPLCI